MGTVSMIDGHTEGRVNTVDVPEALWEWIERFLTDSVIPLTSRPTEAQQTVCDEAARLMNMVNGVNTCHAAKKAIVAHK